MIFTRNTTDALNLLAYAIVVFAAGYCIARLALPISVRSEIIVFAPAVGILVISALTAFWLRFGIASASRN